MKKVNFLEAINSGRRFRPINWNEGIDGDGWYHVNNGVVVFSQESVGIINQKFTNEVDRFNWIFELEEKSVTITESQFYKIVENINCKNSHKSMECDVMDLHSELGF